MSEYKKVSRAELFDKDSSSSESEEELTLPAIEFEFTGPLVTGTSGTVGNSGNEASNELQEVFDFQGNDNEDEQEFEFPLFATFGGEKEINNNNVITDEKRGRSESKLLKISLREPSVEKIVQTRPKQYYFSEYSNTERKQFEAVAITGEEIKDQSLISFPDSHSWRVIDLNSYNDKIEKEILKAQRKKTAKRPGKKKRMNIIKCRERKAERSKIQKELEKKEKARLMKKMYHKRGGKKNKKKTSALNSNQKATSTTTNKPKYRTE
ncbi:hypothetical protein PACTADRAFT_32479 [Pachysolen tannophilus NRRL Y-2460]|uniref:Uncharacterized protein n=1 Tax=Pachysolen tannophilus NRRL Y-2460 TaxID=669874 RepID=A0A1E4TZ73_PACTA|nr:hypothetical protein PACTADRAFT_32479 [Pachysolen tannophilus NRRL Y-2460]